MHVNVIDRRYFPSNNTNFNPKIDNTQNLPLERIIAAVRDEIKDFLPKTKNELLIVLKQIQKEVEFSDTNCTKSVGHLYKKIYNIEHMLELISKSLKVPLPGTPLHVTTSPSEVKSENALNISGVSTELNGIASELAKMDHKNIASLNRSKDGIKTSAEMQRSRDFDKTIASFTANSTNNIIDKLITLKKNEDERQRDGRAFEKRTDAVISDQLDRILQSKQEGEALLIQSIRTAEDKEKDADRAEKDSDRVEKMEVEGSHDHVQSDIIRMGHNVQHDNRLVTEDLLSGPEKKKMEVLDRLMNVDPRGGEFERSRIEKLRIFIERNYPSEVHKQVSTKTVFIQNAQFELNQSMLKDIISKSERLMEYSAIQMAAINIVGQNVVNTALIAVNVGRTTSAGIREAIAESKLTFLAYTTRFIPNNNWKTVVEGVLTVIYYILVILTLTVIGISKFLFNLFKIFPTPVQVAIFGAIFDSLMIHVCRAFEIRPGDTVHVNVNGLLWPPSLFRIIVWFQNTFSESTPEDLPLGGWWTLSVILGICSLIGGGRGSIEVSANCLNILVFCLFTTGNLIQLIPILFQNAKDFIIGGLASGWNPIAQFFTSGTGQVVNAMYYLVGWNSISIELPKPAPSTEIWGRFVKVAYSFPNVDLGLVTITNVEGVDQTMFGSNGDRFTSIFLIALVLAFGTAFVLLKDLKVLTAITNTLRNAWKGNQEVALSAKESLTNAKNTARVALGASRARFRESMGYYARTQYKKYERLQDLPDQNIADLLDVDIIANIKIILKSKQILKDAKNNQRTLQMALAIARALDASDDFPNRVKEMLETQLDALAGSITDNQILSNDSVEKIIQAMSDPQVIDEFRQNIASLGGPPA